MMSVAASWFEVLVVGSGFGKQWCSGSLGSDVSKLQNADNCRKIPYRSSACRRGCSVALAAADLPDTTLTRNIKLKEGVLTLPEQFPDVGSCNAHPKAEDN
jgi:hypothetical protein